MKCVRSLVLSSPEWPSRYRRDAKHDASDALTITANDEAYGAGWRKPTFYEVGMKLHIAPIGKPMPAEIREVLAIERCGPDGWCKLTMSEPEQPMLEAMRQWQSQTAGTGPLFGLDRTPLSRRFDPGCHEAAAEEWRHPRMRGVREA